MKELSGVGGSEEGVLVVVSPGGGEMVIVGGVRGGGVVVVGISTMGRLQPLRRQKWSIRAMKAVICASVGSAMVMRFEVVWVHRDVCQPVSRWPKNPRELFM